VRCPRCGNENPATNRFCGMCGATLLTAAPPAEETAPRAAAPAPVPVPQRAERATERAIEEEPVISGPSFLGLNQPARRQAGSDGQRGSLSIDPNAAPPPRDLDYLLEDDEPKRSGGWTAVAIFLALALAVGLGYLRWRNQGFGWLNLGGAKHSVAQNADDSSVATAPPSTPAEQPNPAPSAGTAGAPATNAVAPGDSSTGNTAAPQANPAGNASPAPEATAPAQPASSQPSTGPNPPSAPVTPLATAPDAKQASVAPPAPSAAGKEPAATTADDSPAPAPADRAKPSAASAVPVKPVDPVAEAQKYLYGKGVPQNCDRGLRLLKPAADHANPKAMIEMGALYSAGLCTPRDLPTAYRWFALALRKEPDNDSVQADLQKLWGEMTQPERQLAIKLSQ